MAGFRHGSKVNESIALGAHARQHRFTPQELLLAGKNLLDWFVKVV